MPIMMEAESQAGILVVPPCMETVFPCQEPKQSKISGDSERICNSIQTGKTECVHLKLPANSLLSKQSSSKLTGIYLQGL